jgi:hypothetical protein
LILAREPRSTSTRVASGIRSLIFDHVTGWHQHLTALHLPASVDDSAWATPVPLTGPVPRTGGMIFIPW